MELYIETLTGTAFELRVSPYETIQDVKARIQKLEGLYTLMIVSSLWSPILGFYDAFSNTYLPILLFSTLWTDVNSVSVLKWWHSYCNFADLITYIDIRTSEGKVPGVLCLPSPISRLIIAPNAGLFSELTGSINCIAIWYSFPSASSAFCWDSIALLTIYWLESGNLVLSGQWAGWKDNSVSTFHYVWSHMHSENWNCSI